MKKKYLFLWCLFSLPLMVVGQWTKGKGKGYYKLSAWYLKADEHFTDTGDKDPNATRGQFNLNFYVEYGVSDRWDAVAYVPFFARTYQNDIVSGTTGDVIDPGEDLNSIGDINVGFRYALLQKEKYALSASLVFGLPTGNDSGGSDGSYQTGDGEFNQLAKISLGIPFSIQGKSTYAKTYLGYNNRTQDFSDEFRFGAEFGIQLLNKLWIAGKLDVVESMKNGSLSAQTTPGSIFANNVEYAAIGGEVNYYLSKKWGLSFNYTSTLSGRIIYAAPSISGGVFLDVK